MPTVWGVGGSRVWIKNMGKKVNLKVHRDFHRILEELAEKGLTDN